MLIVRDLMIGPMRYSELLASLPGITTNLLAKRLKSLQDQGILEKKVQQGPLKSSLYSLTQKGKALEPVLKALGDWGLRHGRPPSEDDQLNPRWLLFFLQRLYKKPQSKAWIELRIQDRSFQFQVGGPQIEALEGNPLTPDLKISGTAQAFIAFLSAERTLAELLETGDLQAEGDSPARQTLLEALGFQTE
jgi:DNA-binding HxlR family transcriptional regulator